MLRKTNIDHVPLSKVMELALRISHYSDEAAPEEFTLCKDGFLPIRELDIRCIVMSPARKQFMCAHPLATGNLILVGVSWPTEWFSPRLMPTNFEA